MCNLRQILIAFYLIFCDNLCRGNDWLHSMSSMNELYDLGMKLLTETEKYIENEYKRLDDIKHFIEQRETQNARELAEAYTESSINAFKTMLRVKTDWETLKNEMAPSTVLEFKTDLVTNEHMNSALRALRRFQIVYEIQVSDLANGEVGGYTFEKFNVDDCYQMADLCFEHVECHCAYHWFNEAYKKFKEDNSTATFDYSDLITKYIWSSYLIGNIDTARTIMEKYFVENNYVLNDVLTNVRYVIWNQDKVFKRNTAEDRDKMFYSQTLQKLNSYGDVSSYIHGCQAWWYVSPYLKSRYFYGGDAFLWMAPLQEETVSIIPNMKMYHNVLFDDEIRIIKELAKPELKRLPTDINEDISLRKVATFQKHNSSVFEVIEKRILLMASKTKANVLDKFVVTNYGVNGHYLPHTNFIDEDHMINGEGRTAVVIFHLDDVPVGGFTVVPEVYVNIPSIKGSALVIYNTRHMISPFGQPMFPNTQYGSCPIFYGDKWTLTGWFLNED